jgi:hypothetical protein
VLDFRTDLAVGGKASQPVRHRLVATPLQRPQQSPHVAFREAQLIDRLRLGNQLLLRLLQGHQAIPFSLCHL